MNPQFAKRSKINSVAINKVVPPSLNNTFRTETFFSSKPMEISVSSATSGKPLLKRHLEDSLSNSPSKKLKVDGLQNSLEGINMKKYDTFPSISQMNEFVVSDQFSQTKHNITVKTNTDLDEFQFTQYCDNSQFMSELETAIAKIKEIHKIQSSQNVLERDTKGNADISKSICLNGDGNDNEFDLSFNQSIYKREPKIRRLLTKQLEGSDILKNVVKHAEDSVHINMEQFASTDSTIGKMIKSALMNNVNKTLTQGKLQNATLIERDNAGDFQSHGDFFGLPNIIKDLIKVYKGIDKFYDWQEECLNLPAIAARHNLIYALPTSGGKTLVAEILILREIICRNKNAIFILPYVAIVHEKVWAMAPFAVALEFLVEQYAAGKGNYPPRTRRRKNSVYICTIEKALGLMNSLIETNRTDEIGLVVVDELHLLGEGSRGACLETLLTKVKMIKNKIQIVGMSATIGNIDEISQFLDADVYTKDFRPVELIEYVKCHNEIARVNKNATDADELLTLEKNVNYYKNMAKLEAIDPDHLGGLVMDVIPNASCLVFCRSRQSCENVANLLCKVLKPDLRKHRHTEKIQIKNALRDAVGSLCDVLGHTISYGVAYHHSGLTAEERCVVEDAFRQGIISVICCTSTLAAGVNLPAKRVIIRNPYVGREFINLSRYKQMIGRAGRAGLGEIGESIIICTPQELPRIKSLLMSTMDVALSSMHDNDGDGLQNFLLSCVSLGLARTKKDLQTLADKTLMAIQADRLGVDVRKVTRQAMRYLFKWGALETKNMVGKCVLDQSISAKFENTFPSSTCQSIEAASCENKNIKVVINIDNDTPLQISQLGSAARKGGLDLNRAHILYEDLLKAQSNIILFTGLHLMYLVIPYTISEQVNPEKSLYYSLYTKLNKREVQTAKVLGITDAIACKLLTNRKITEVSERVMNRFYVTLMLYDLLNEMPVYDVSIKYEVNRGLIQNLMISTSTFASNVYRFCIEFDEFWAFSLLLKGMSDRLSHCCIKELVPLMKLPTVTENRAKQLYNAGYKTLQSIARADPEQLMQKIDLMSRKFAIQLITAAKMVLLEKVENLLN